MADIRTTHTVTINGKYKIRVANELNGTYEAAVVKEKVPSIAGSAMRMVQGALDMEDPGWMEVDDAPLASGETSLVAAAIATEKYIEEGSPTSVKL